MALTPAQEALAKAMSEDELQGTVRDMGKLRRWYAYHTYNSRKSEPGFPDLVMVRDGRLLFLELKRQNGKVSPAQADVLRKLQQVPCAEVHIVRPSDLLCGAVLALLT